MSSVAGRPQPVVPWAELRRPGLEVLVQLAVVAAALVALGGQDPSGWPGRTTAVLSLVGATVTAVLLATGGWVSDNRRAVRIAGAVAVYAAIELLPGPIGAGPPTGMWALTCSVALLGVVGFLALAVRASADRVGDRIAAAVVVAALAVATGALAVVVAAVPGMSPPPDLVRAADLVVWSGAGAGAVVVFIAGTVADRALLRGTALGFATLAVANAVRIVIGAEAVAVALQVAGLVMLLAVAVRFTQVEVGTVTRKRVALIEAQAAVAELRRAQGGEPPAPIGPLLGELAVVYRHSGLVIQVEVDGDPETPVRAGQLTAVLVEVLADCAEQAPGARVRLRAEPSSGRLWIEVVDDGPALAPDTVAALVQRGGTGPRSNPIGALLTDRHAGVVTVLDAPDDREPSRWRAELDLPIAGRGDRR